MFAHVMFILQVLGGRGGAGVHLAGQQGHFGNFFQHHGVVDGLGRILAPGKGTVAVADDPRHRHRIDLAAGEGFNNDFAGVFLVILVQLFFGQVAGAGLFSQQRAACGPPVVAFSHKGPYLQTTSCTAFHLFCSLFRFLRNVPVKNA